MNTRNVGNITEMKAMTKFLETGYDVLFPFGDNAKYDFVVIKEEVIKKIQCKTSRISRCGTSFNFNTSVVASNCNGSRVKHYTKKDIDAFVTVWNDKLYYIPAEIALKKSRIFSLIIKDKEKFSEKQKAKLSFAEDFELKNDTLL